MEFILKPLKNLSAVELSKILNEAQAELQRRDNAAKAQKEIQAILQKYNLDIADLDFSSTKTRASVKKVQPSAAKNQLSLKKILKKTTEQSC